MTNRNILETFSARILILGLNFLLVIVSTHFWGSSGRGIISLVVADLALIGFFSNIFSGGSITYFASKYSKSQVLAYAYIWSFVVGFSIPWGLGLFHGGSYLYELIVLSILSSLLNANINLFVGMQNIRMYNVYTILTQALQIAFILLFFFILKDKRVDAYFMAQICAYFLLFMASTIQLAKHWRPGKKSLSTPIFRDMFTYGWKTQLSAFMQFLNYRLSFYFLEFFRGVASVGIYSVGVVVSEAVWSISRSLSVILYSEVVNSNSQEDSIAQTKTSMRIAFWVTLFFLAVILVFPSQFYVFIFGKDFFDTKKIVLLLSPGILAIAVSNIAGHYFSGTNQLGILNIKSLIGLFITIVSSYIFVPRWGIVAVCLITSLSYLVSSGILFIKFYSKTDFNLRDFLIKKKEIQNLLKKFK